MTITYTREYPRAAISPSEGNLSNVIKSVYCICRGTDENGNYETMGADITLNEPIAEQFIDFSSITKDVIDSWVVQTQQYTELQNSIEKSMTEKLNSTVIVDLSFS